MPVRSTQRDLKSPRATETIALDAPRQPPILAAATVGTAVAYLALPLDEAVLAQSPVKGGLQLVQLRPVVSQPHRQVSIVRLLGDR